MGSIPTRPTKKVFISLSGKNFFVCLSSGDPGNLPAGRQGFVRQRRIRPWRKLATFPMHVGTLYPKSLNTDYIISSSVDSGAPGKIRTCYLLVRSQALYPNELRVQNLYQYIYPNYSLWPLFALYLIQYKKTPNFMEFFNGTVYLKAKGLTVTSIFGIYPFPSRILLTTLS